MKIYKNERTPEYFGCIAKINKLSPNMNPYSKDDPNRIRWQEGFIQGELVNENY
jgi:hypothetical protein